MFKTTPKDNFAAKVFLSLDLLVNKQSSNDFFFLWQQQGDGRSGDEEKSCVV
jgi:hypothetical protein